jgi:hypothetical protein
MLFKTGLSPLGTSGLLEAKKIHYQNRIHLF